jgi:hypothetical protein
MRGRSLVTVIAIAVVVVVVVVVVARTGSDKGGDGASSPKPVGLRLSSGMSSPTVSSLLIPMGHLDDPANTFWELFLRKAGSKAWVLRTPPGVADNGGVVVSLPAQGPLTAGFLPSANLEFSPLAQSADSGKTWSTGELPAGLVASPDALAANTAGGLLALVSTGAGTVLSSPGDLRSWTTLVTKGDLAGAVPGCRVSAITAVSFDATGQPLLGVGCATAGRIGILSRSSASQATQATAWQNVGPTLAGGQPGTATVVRLEDTAQGMAGVAAVKSSDRWWLVAFWGQGSLGQWVQSTAAPVPSGWTLESTAVGGDQRGVTVMLAAGDRRRVEQLSGPGAAWVTLAPAPAGAGAVAAVGSEVDTFVSSGSQITVWAWTPGATGWSRTAVTTVPVQYGSSTS